MKPIYGIDITHDKKNETFNGSEFITRESSRHTLDAVESKQAELLETVEKCKLPLWMRIVHWVSGIYALLMLAALSRVLEDTDFADLFDKASWLIFSAVAAAVLWVVLLFVERAKAKRVSAEEGIDHKVEDIDDDMQALYRELNVPDTADTVDVLMFKYKEKNGEIIPGGSSVLASSPYHNLEVKMYVADGALCLADIETVYSFDLSELRSIKTVNKRISVPIWNKDEEPSEGRFKKYKLKVDEAEDVYFKPFHILEIDHYGSIFGIYFPCYELEIFERLTGLKADV